MRIAIVRIAGLGVEVKGNFGNNILDKIGFSLRTFPARRSLNGSTMLCAKCSQCQRMNCSGGNSGRRTKRKPSGLRKTHEAPIQAVASGKECRAARSIGALVLRFDAHCDWLRSSTPRPVRLHKHLWHDFYSSADRTRLIRHLNRRFLPSEKTSLENGVILLSILLPKFWRRRVNLSRMQRRPPGAKALAFGGLTARLKSCPSRAAWRQRSLQRRA
jgi:hypothetical protein